MDPQEQKTTHSYPNADRKIGDSEMPSKNMDRPLVHISDVLSPLHKDPNSQTERTSSVHTFRDDLNESASNGDFSVSKIVMANSKKNRESLSQPRNSSGGKDRHIATILLVLILCVLIIGGFSYLGYKSAKDNVTTTNQAGTAQQLMYVEQNITIDVKDKSWSDLSTEISNQTMPEKLVAGKIKAINFEYKDGTSTIPLSASDFLSVIAPSAPGILLRNIKKDYVFGYYSYSSVDPFIILESTDYDSVFAGMLEWESRMFADLGDLIYKKENLPPVAIPDSEQKLSTEQSSNPEANLGSATSSFTSTSTASSSTTSASQISATTSQKIVNGTTSSSTTKASTKTTASTVSTVKTAVVKNTTNLTDSTRTEFNTKFVDKVIINNDTRVLYRPNGEIAFFYTFFNKNLLIITTGEQTLREIIHRLTSGKITR